MLRVKPCIVDCCSSQPLSERLGGLRAPVFFAYIRMHMPFDTAAKAVVIWLVILFFAMANGFLREAVLTPTLGVTPGLLMSGLLLCGCVLLPTWLLLPWLGTRVPEHLLMIGLGWLLLTLVFEFSFGLLAGKPLPELLDAYTFRDGNLWPVVLAVIVGAPWLAAKLRGWF